MKPDAARRLIERHFGATTDAPDTTRAQPGTTVDPNGLVWAWKCGCGLHRGPVSQTRGHDAKPVARAGRSAA